MNMNNNNNLKMNNGNCEKINSEKIKECGKKLGENIEKIKMVICYTENNTFNSNDFLNFGKDIDEIINKYVFDLERNDLITNHKINFDNVLEEINGKKYKDLYDMLYDDLDWEVDNDNNFIEFNFIGSYNNMDYDGGNNIHNCNNWVGFTKGELLNDLLFNWRFFENWNTYEEFLEEMILEEEWEDEEILYEQWENMEMISMVFEDLIEEFEIEKDDFLIWCNEEL